MNRATLALPIAAALPQLGAALAAHAAVVLQAPPGAGKSTGVPLALLEARWLQGKIVMLEPRRLAARGVAARLAANLGESPGQTIGYRTRLDTQVGPRTRVEVVTEGILTRMLQRDPALEGVALVIFDEFHERSLHADLALALCLDAQGALREDLKLLVMSATLDGAAVAAFLGNAPIVTAEGRSFPVDTHYRSATAPRKIWQDPDIARDVANVALRALAHDDGDLLVFLPGQGEIRRVQRLLEEQTLPDGVRIHPLYGELSPSEQDAAIQLANHRKVVLSTNIAETSLTIEGVRAVIDSGLERRARFDPATGMSRLDTLRISRASADQRRGRAGRVQSGVCYRLWTESEQDALAAHTPPEIVAADLAPLALELANWGVREPQALRWLTPPPAATFSQARDLLTLLGALDEQGLITAHGREMNNLGAHPRLAHMLLRAKQAGAARLGAELAALLSERDVLRPKTGQMNHERDVDLRTRIDVLRGGRSAGFEAESAARQRVLRSADLFMQQLGEKSDTRRGDVDVGCLLALAYPDRIAQARGDGRYLLANGRGAMLRSPQALGKAEFLVAAELDGGEREAQIRLAAPLSTEDLEQEFASRIQTLERIEWSDREQAVIARRERRLDALTLEAQRLDKPDPQLVLTAMLEGIRRMGLDVLPWNDDAKRMRSRMKFARTHDQRAPQPWPSVDDEALLAELDTWLGPWLHEVSRRSQLAALDLQAILLARLDWGQQQRLSEIAPTHLTVPSGSSVRIDYDGTQPTLSVRLQEVFGLTETPRVGGGAVPVLMELLSPARRPVQLTQDLASFWARGYHDVKKDLKGRYPKHYWPDNPLQAEPTARAKPRGT